MRQRMKKVFVCFMAALAVLVSVLSVSGISYAAEQDGEWVPFALGGAFLYPTSFVPVDVPDPVFPFNYVAEYMGELPVVSGSSYRIKIAFDVGNGQEVHTPYAICTLDVSEIVQDDVPITIYTFTANTEQFGYEGTLQLVVLVASLDKFAVAGIINNSSVEFAGEPFTLYLETLNSSGVPSAVHGTPAFASGQFINESVLEYGTAIFYSWDNMDPPPALNPSPTGLYKIQYGSSEYIVSVLPHEPSTDGAQAEWWIYSSGTQLGAYWQGGPMQYDVGNLQSSMVLAIPNQEGATLSFTVYDPYGGSESPRSFADLPTFFGEAGSALDWLISAFGVFLAFMLKNPICFIGLIVSLVVLAVKLIQSTTGNK